MIEADGRIVGQQLSDQTIEDVAHELTEIDPPVFATIDRVPVSGEREVLVVGLPVGQSQPYSHRGHAYRPTTTCHSGCSLIL